MKHESKIFICNNHHEVLPAWAKLFRKDHIRRDVLTLDHHTDVLPAFSRSEKTGSFDASSQQAVLKAVALLHHDEHIDWALRAEIIASSVILSHECFTQPAHPKITIVKSPRWPETQEILNASEQARKAADSVLETEFLSEELQNISFGKHFILDIDLDNFLTEKSLEPEDPALFLSLAERAELITFSREKEWVRLLKFPGENIDDEKILQKLLSMLERPKSQRIQNDRD